jgi:hypothetical protein
MAIIRNTYHLIDNSLELGVQLISDNVPSIIETSSNTTKACVTHVQAWSKLALVKAEAKIRFVDNNKEFIAKAEEARQSEDYMSDLASDLSCENNPESLAKAITDKLNAFNKLKELVKTPVQSQEKEKSEEENNDAENEINNLRHPS